MKRIALLTLIAALVLAATADANMRLAGPEAIAKAQRVISQLQLAAFADSNEIRDCDRLSTRRITCRYVFDFSGRIAPCEDRITLTTRRDRGERYIGWTIGKSALDCSAGLDIPTVEIAP